MTHRSTLLPLALGVLLLAPRPALADVESWNHIETTVPLSDQDDWLPDSLRVTAGSRFSGRHDGLGQSTLRIGPTWHVHPHLMLASYVSAYANKDSQGRFEPELRWGIEPNLRWRFGAWHVNDRNRLEWRQKPDQGFWRYRNQLRVVLQQDDWPVWPMVAEEVHFHLNGDGFAQNRLSAGMMIPVSTSTRLAFEYIFRSRIAGAGWDHDHILNLTLNYAPVLGAIVDAALETGP